MAKGENDRAQGRDGRRMKRLLTAVGIFAGAGALLWMIMGGFGTAVDYRDAALVKRGETLFAQNCSACHGDKAVGENPRFLKGGEKPGGGFWAPALNGAAHTWHHPPDALFQIIKEGSPARNSPMRGWGDRLNDQDVHSLLAYFQSLWPDPLRRRYEQSVMRK